MKIGVLGPLCLGDGTLRIGSTKERALLEVLALHVPNGASIVDVVAGLWGDAPPQSAERTVQSLVSRLRHSVPDLVIKRSEHEYWLRVAPGEVDACMFEQLIGSARAIGTPTRSASLLREALDLWRGSPAPDVESGSGVWSRIRLEDERRNAEEELWALRLTLGELAGLSAEIEAAALVEPWREGRWARLIIALYLEGRRVEASRAYQRVRRLFNDELGLDPGPLLQALDRAVIRDERATIDDILRDLRFRPDATASPRAPSRAVAVVPDWLTRFVGRELERTFIIDALARSRLVTLTGPGGVGKTRLAAETCRELLPRFPDGLWFVDLAGTHDEASVLAAITTAVDVPPMPGLTLQEATVAACTGLRALLVLDNAEHVVAHVALIVRALLQDGRGLRVLATSREAIGLDGEHRLPLQPLTVPGPDEHDIGALLANESIALLLDRATAVAPHFQIDSSNAPALASLARRFDGLPLALELGAAQFDAFSPTDLDTMLKAHLALPANSRRGPVGRHRSIDAAVDWSYQLLSSEERTVLDRMSVFRGPATLDAIRSIVIDDLIVDDDLFDHLVSLVRRSLIVATGAGAERRYRLLETTREAGWRRLEAEGRLDEFRDRHFDWILSRANEAALALSGPARAVRTRELDLEFDNLEAALSWSAHDSHTAGRALDVVSRLIGYWLSVGNRRECGLRTATELVDAATDMEPAQRAEAVMLAGGMALVDDLAAARRLAEVARRCAEGAAPDSHVALIASLTASFPEWAGGDPRAARALAGRALSLEGFPGVIAKWVSASCLALEGDLGTAHARILEVAETMRAFGDEHFYGYHLARSADFGYALGIPADQLVPRAREALAIATIQCPSCEGEALSTLALVDGCAEFGGPLRAAQLGLARADELGELLTVVSDLGLLVGLHSLAGASEHAAWLHGATTALRARSGFVEIAPGRLAHHRLGVLVAERSLGADRFAELSREAADVPYTETIETALSTTAATAR